MRAAKRLAVQLSSGGAKAATLAKWGHPFAKHYTGNVSLDPSIANKQSGAFQSRWQSVPPATNMTNGKIETKLINTAPEAKYFDPKRYPKGTRRMVARPFAFHQTMSWTSS